MYNLIKQCNTLLCCNFPYNHLVSVQTALKREREATNEIKCEPTQSAAADLLLNESHATANVSLLACLQNLSTATLDIGAHI